MRHIVFIALTIYSLNTFANYMDEVDLTGGAPESIEILDRIIHPDDIDTRSNSNDETRVIFSVNNNDGTHELVQMPDLEINCKEQVAKAKFINKYFRVKKAYNFEISGHVECNKTNVWSFNRGTAAAEVVSIFNIAQKAVNKLSENGIINFWKKQITLKWPSDGDYYNWNTVHITRGYQWDVVGHELGHAIYDQADLGHMGGGSHRIDECYTKSLALSEGWASFFSAWLSINLRDIDAKFEYLVPRRAPIRFENIPSDVCAGQTNEWRVTGFLWDLIDLAADDENSNMTFADLFNVALKKSFPDTRSYANTVVKRGFDPILMNIVWKNNFLTDL